MKGFQDIEDELAKSSAERVLALIAEDLESNIRTAVQYSEWDDTYNYVKKPTEEYIKLNYESEAIFAARFNVVAISNQESDIILCRAYELKELKHIPCSDAVRQMIERKLVLVGPTDSEKTHKGVVQLQDSLITEMTITPILTSEGLGPAVGHFVTMRHLDALMIERLQNVVKYPLRLSVEDTKMDGIVEANSEKIVAHFSEPLWQSQSYLVAEVDYPRSISNQGKRVVGVFILLIGVGVVGIMMLIFWVFNTNVMQPLNRIKSRLKSIGVSADLSQRLEQKSQDEIGQLIAEINSTLGRLEEAQASVGRASIFSALGEMAGQLAHEINNPLAVIMGYSNRLSKDPASFSHDQIKDLASKIHFTGLRIERIVRSLRLVSRDGAQDPKEDVLLGDILDEAVILSEAKLHGQGIKLQVDSFDKYLKVQGRNIQLIQVVLNLLSNAVDAVESLEEKWIEVRTETQAGQVYLRVIDSGRGIPEEVVQKLMDPFFSTKGAGKGTGLGLSISKKIIEDHNGSLEYELYKGHTSFVIILPLVQ